MEPSRGPRVELRGRNLPIGTTRLFGPEGWLPAGHLSLALFPEDAAQQPRTLAGWLSPGGLLRGHKNYPGDNPGRSSRRGLIVPPEGTSPEELFERMEEALDNYNANGPLAYQLWPGPNSNSFARALIELSGGRLDAARLFGRAPWRLYPGWKNVIAPERFAPRQEA